MEIDPESNDLPTCRICLGPQEQNNDPLIHPCKCRGSTKWVHRQCLNTWRNTNARLYFQCDICHFRYKLRNLQWAALLRHIYVQTAVVVSTITCSVFFSGIFISWVIAEPYELLHVLEYGAIACGFIGFFMFLVLWCIEEDMRNFRDWCPFECNSCDFRGCSFQMVLIAVVALGLLLFIFSLYKVFEKVCNRSLNYVGDIIENVN